MNNSLLLEKRIAALFISKGWDARLSNEVQLSKEQRRFQPDILLFDDGKPVGAVEVKTYRNNTEKVRSYARALSQALGLSFFLLFIDFQMYIYTSDGFKTISTVPTPDTYRDYSLLTKTANDEEFDRLLVLIRHIDALKEGVRSGKSVTSRASQEYISIDQCCESIVYPKFKTVDNASKVKKIKAPKNQSEVSKHAQLSSKKQPPKENVCILSDSAKKSDKPIFISYKSQERSTADRIINYLTDAGYSCWIAPESIPGGQNYQKVIPDAIETCFAFIFLLSSRSQESEWCLDELTAAKEYRKVIIPYKIEQFELNKDVRFLLSRKQIIGTKDELISALNYIE